MRFKEVGKKLQLIRPVYVPEDRRTREKMIGSIDSNAEEATPEILALLNDEEKYQLKYTLATRSAHRAFDACKAALETGVVETIGTAITALSWVGMAEQMTPAQVSAMLSALDEMRSAMCKAGLVEPSPALG